MEVGGKRTIKYQNTSYGIDMQMLRAAPTDFAHAHLDGHLSIGHRGSKQVLADAAIIVGRATAAVLTILFAREETWDVNWAPHTSHKSQSNLLACSTHKLLFGGVYTTSLELLLLLPHHSELSRPILGVHHGFGDIFLTVVDSAPSAILLCLQGLMTPMVRSWGWWWYLMLLNIAYTLAIFRKKRFALNFLFRLNASKFAIFHS